MVVQNAHLSLAQKLEVIYVSMQRSSSHLSQ